MTFILSVSKRVFERLSASTRRYLMYISVSSESHSKKCQRVATELVLGHQYADLICYQNYRPCLPRHSWIPEHTTSTTPHRKRGKLSCFQSALVCGWDSKTDRACRIRDWYQPAVSRATASRAGRGKLMLKDAAVTPEAVSEEQMMRSMGL